MSRIGPTAGVRFLAQDYLASIFTQATLTVLPLLVIAILGARQSAYFAMPFTIVMAFDTFAYSACTSLVVEATLERESLRALTVGLRSPRTHVADARGGGCSLWRHHW